MVLIVYYAYFPAACCSNTIRENLLLLRILGPQNSSIYGELRQPECAVYWYLKLTKGIGIRTTATRAKSVFPHRYPRASNICVVNNGKAKPMRFPAGG